MTGFVLENKESNRRWLEEHSFKRANQSVMMLSPPENETKLRGSTVAIPPFNKETNKKTQGINDVLAQHPTEFVLAYASQRFSANH